MNRILKTAILTVLIVVLAVFASSCKKKEVKKIVVNNQFAISLFNDTISVKDIINDMDSTTNSWLRVKEDGSLCAYYADSVNSIIKASDFLSDIPDVSFESETEFSMQPITDSEEKDTTVFSDRFTEIPFEYDDFIIDTVVLRSGIFTFNLDITPLNGASEFTLLKRIVIFSNQLVSQDNVPLRIQVDYGRNGASVDLAGYKIRPDEDKKVYFSSEITFHYIPSEGFDGGDYKCNLHDGGLTDVSFKTVFATVTKTIDSTYSDHLPIDFGINGLSGSAFLPVPDINLTYRNTFGLSASTFVDTLQFYSPTIGITDLLAAPTWEEVITPTNGEYVSRPIGNFVDEIDALAGYTRFDFSGKVTLLEAGQHVSISDTSAIDVIADVEMPFSFKIDDLRYLDTVDISFGDDVNIQNYLDEIDFTIDYRNLIPLEVELQALFMKNGVVIDSLFNGNCLLAYGDTQNPPIECIITDDKLFNVLRANQLILRVGVSTTNISSGDVTILESNSIAIRMKMLTKSTEISMDDIL